MIIWEIGINMLISLPSQQWARATDTIRPGSLIEYEYYTSGSGFKTARAYALVVSVSRQTNVSRSSLRILSSSHEPHVSLRMAKVCQIIII